ncbi:MAG: ArsA family ATPase [Mycobacterium sp.]|nr:ArsA family ATPase [Mycobacterium sp.]
MSFFVGKGGVGKSTLAAATAVQVGLGGQRALVVSTDQAHSLGDVLGTPVDPGFEPVRILTEEHGGQLDALALDTLRLLESAWRSTAALFAERFPDSELNNLAAEELSGIPGVQEVLGLKAVAEFAATGRWDHVVVDCASTADALRMLTLPAALAMYAERAWPRHRRLSAGTDNSRSAALAALIEAVNTWVTGLADLIADDTRVGAHLVLTAERVVAAESVRAMASLSVMGVPVTEVIVNQVLFQDDSYEYRNLPEHPAFEWYAARIAEQQSVLDQLSAAAGELRLVLTPHLPGEPIGPKALAQLLDEARRRDGAAPPAPLRPVVDRESGSGIDAVYRMRLELPPVDVGTLDLGRSGEDLILRLGGLRRRVRLAPVLRRCVVTGASVRGSELTIRFRPDPEVWPA